MAGFEALRSISFRCCSLPGSYFNSYHVCSYLERWMEHSCHCIGKEIEEHSGRRKVIYTELYRHRRKDLGLQSCLVWGSFLLATKPCSFSGHLFLFIKWWSQLAGLLQIIFEHKKKKASRANPTEIQIQDFWGGSVIKFQPCKHGVQGQKFPEYAQ